MLIISRRTAAICVMAALSASPRKAVNYCYGISNVSSARKALGAHLRAGLLMLNRGSGRRHAG
jgi:hypothetical protein